MLPAVGREGVVLSRLLPYLLDSNEITPSLIHATADSASESHKYMQQCFMCIIYYAVMKRGLLALSMFKYSGTQNGMVWRYVTNGFGQLRKRSSLSEVLSLIKGFIAIFTRYISSCFKGIQ